MPGKVVTEVEATRPVVTADEAKMLPSAAVQFTVMRTGGRGYGGVNGVFSVRSQVFRKGSHRFGTRNQLTPPVVPVPATGQAANELR